MLPRQLKWAKQRVTKGYCRSDWYDMDSWFAHVVADMFDEYAENTCSHPWEINDPDDWKDILKEMATHLRNAGIEEIAKERYIYKCIWSRNSTGNRNTSGIVTFRNNDHGMSAQRL